MNTLVLLVERRSTWSPEKWACEQGVQRDISGRILIEREAGWLSVVQDDQVLNDFDEEELLRLMKLVDEPTAYLVEWKGSSLLESFLRSIPLEIHAAIDNDHGLLISVHEIVGKPLTSWVKVKKLP